MALTEDDVLRILDLIEKSEFDFLELELGDLKLVVRKGGNIEQTSAQNSPGTADANAERKTATVAVERGASEAPKTDLTEIDLEGLVAIKAPMVGTFYVAPEPGAAAFITEGARVEAETPVGLIEVMKVFSSVRAGVRGTVSKILVANAQLVEYGQVLFLVQPD